MSRKLRWTISGALLVGAAALVGGRAGADQASEARARCAVRLSIAFTGGSPSAALLAEPLPQNGIDGLLQSPEFLERFARFVNATFNDEPGAKASEDASYFLAREVVGKGLLWKELFSGHYRVDVAAGGMPNSENVTVVADPQGLGYFRSRPWQVRYAGNELEGLKINTAYRIMHNTIGLRLTATTNAPGVDLSATGRRAAACTSCHFDSAFALDKVASILTTRQGSGDAVTFVAPKATLVSDVLSKQAVTDDKSLVETLISSDSFKFAACRTAFRYLYGREENKCEGPLFDRCMDAFAQTGTIQSAIKTVAGDPSFCQPGDPGAVNDPGNNPNPDPPGANCTEGKVYTGFDGKPLQAGRVVDDIGGDRGRVKPYSALSGEYQRVLGAAPPSLATKAASFTAPQARWHGEPFGSAVTLYTSLEIAFEGCLTLTQAGAQYASPPAEAAAQTECAAWATRFWNRPPLQAEVDACAGVAVVDTTSETEARRRWAYACAATLNSSGFLTY